MPSVWVVVEAVVATTGETTDNQAAIFFAYGQSNRVGRRVEFGRFGCANLLFKGPE